MTLESAILIAGVLLLAGTLSSKLSDRLGLPSLLLFLGIGMLAGSEGVGGIVFGSPETAQVIGTVALLVILFAGGLDTDWKAVRPVLGQGLLLATAGVVVTALLLGTFAWFMLGTYTTFDLGPRGVTWTEALLLAAIVSSTDAAAVFSVYRTSPVQPLRRLRSLLEFESGSNDPMAVLLTVAILGIMTHAGASSAGVVGELVIQFMVGGVVGGLVGFCGVIVANRIRLSTRGLYPILVLALGLAAFGAAHRLHGNGFLAVYVAGLVIGNRIRVGHDAILTFHEGLSWLMQIAMFIVLGLLVSPLKLLPVAGVSVAMAFFLMFCARPVSVALCSLPFRPRKNELAYVSWVGLRGSVPIVLATFPASYGLAGADQVFHVIFFIVLTSVVVQGLTLVPCARWLGVVVPDDKPGKPGG